MKTKEAKTKSAGEPSAAYEYRDIVLAKIRGYPAWPGMVRASPHTKLACRSLTWSRLQVVDPETVPPRVVHERPQGKKKFFCVRFFPAGD